MATVAGIESSAIGLLTRAVEMDGSRRFTEALVCYQEGLKLLLDVIKATHEERKKQHLRQKVTEYMDRAEKLKTFIENEKATGKYHEQIQILENSTGYSYNKLFSPYLDADLTAVVVEDPYIRHHHQVCNFLRFCELLVKSRANVKQIHLVTGSSEASDSLKGIAVSLQQHGVQLSVEINIALHDREIRLNNGWIVKIGRGLDYFKPSPNKLSIGHFDYDLRPCHQTTVDIFFKR